MLLARVGFSGAALAGRGTTASVQTRQSLRLLSLKSLRPDLHCLADEDQPSFEVTNPATGELVALVPDQTKAEVKQVLQSVHDGGAAWAATTAKERAVILREWHHLMLQNKKYLAELVSTEQGKVIAEAQGEVAYGASFIAWFAEQGLRAYGDVIPSDAPNQTLIVTKEAVGLCALITPWNFPIAMITRKAGAALAAGCTAVVKPSEDTPLSAQAIVALGHQAGVPSDVLGIVTCGRDSVVDIGKELCTNPLVRKVSFTGSTAVGTQLMQWSAQTVKRVSMELGGNAPFLVFDDADLDKAIAGVMASKFRNAGQTCVCTNRILVQSSVKDEFLKRLVEATNDLQVGNGLDSSNHVGPLINRRAVEKVSQLVTDAVDSGAKVLLGGSEHPEGPNFYKPTVLSNVTTDMELFKSEIFGPVAAVATFETEEEGIELANATSAGLVAYFYAESSSRVWRVSRALKTGMVGANTGLISTEVAPFGGVKESGLGREGSHEGLDEYLDTKYIRFDHN